MLSMITTSSCVVLNMIYEQALLVSARARAASEISLPGAERDKNARTYRAFCSACVLAVCQLFK